MFMKKKIRGLKRVTFQLDFNLYRVNVPIKHSPGFNLSVIDLAPEQVQRAIVFVHGFAGVAESWEFQINYFSSFYRVVAPDLRGHGQSDAPYTEYTMPELVEDIETIANELDLPEKFILVGHSFGGSICVEYADAHPERLEKLVLIATAGEYPVPRAASLLSKVPIYIMRPLWKYRPRWDAEIHVMKRMFLNNMRKWKGWTQLRNISTDTLIITGERDNYFPRYVFDDVGKMVPNAEIYDVGSAKHKVQLERHEAVNRAIERFTDEQQRSSWREESNNKPLLKQRPWLRSYYKDTPHTLPIPRQPLHRFLESAADWQPKQIATVFYGKTLTYQQLDEKANQFARALRQIGIQVGDRVMIVLPNTPQMVIAYYGVLKAGAVVVMPNPDATAERIVEQATQTDAKVLVTLSAFSKLAGALQQYTNTKTAIFTSIGKHMTEDVYKAFLESRGVSEEDENLARRIGRFMTEITENELTSAPGIKVQHDQLAVIVYTSGTTNQPKGVCLTHANLVANALQTRHWIPEVEYGKEVVLSVIPFMHSYGMTSAMNVPITLAATMVILSVFELEQILEHIKHYKPTLFPGVPSMYTAINQAKNVRSYGLSSIKACISGAAPLPVEVQEAFEKLTRGRLVEGYGLSEASPVTHANPLFGVRKVGSIGMPLPNTDAKIVDLISREELPAGKIGELAVKGPQVMSGYWGDSDEDEESVLEDGWLYTGDVAIMDDDGYFKIISRKRDTIMTGDFSVYPRDVEEVLYENNKVLEVAVVGVGHADGKQKVKAFVVPRPNTKLSKEELIDLCKRRLEEYAVPWDIEFREELPKSFVGKVLRRLLTEDNTEH